MFACADLVGADFDDLQHPRPGGTGGTEASGGASGSSGDAGHAAAGGGGTAGDGDASDADAPSDAGPDAYLLQGAFVGGAVSGEGNGLKLRARIVWHGKVEGSSNGYRIEGWLR